MRQPNRLNFRSLPENLFPSKRHSYRRQPPLVGSTLTQFMAESQNSDRSQGHQVLGDQRPYFLEAYEHQASTVR